MLHEVATLGVELRASIHAGEISVIGDTIAGLGVHIASRVMDRARDGHIAVSSTVRELTVGSAIRYDELGVFPLEGAPGEWRIYEVV
jgi:class 3 adenylate cyclase